MFVVLVIAILFFFTNNIFIPFGLLAGVVDLIYIIIKAIRHEPVPWHILFPIYPITDTYLKKHPYDYMGFKNPIQCPYCHKTISSYYVYCPECHKQVLSGKEEADKRYESFKKEKIAELNIESRERLKCIECWLPIIIFFWILFGLMEIFFNHVTPPGVMLLMTVGGLTLIILWIAIMDAKVMAKDSFKRIEEEAARDMLSEIFGKQREEIEENANKFSYSKEAFYIIRDIDKSEMNTYYINRRFERAFYNAENKLDATENVYRKHDMDCKYKWG